MTQAEPAKPAVDPLVVSDDEIDEVLAEAGGDLREAIRKSGAIIANLGQFI